LYSGQVIDTFFQFDFSVHGPKLLVVRLGLVAGSPLRHIKLFRLAGV